MATEQGWRSLLAASPGTNKGCEIFCSGYSAEDDAEETVLGGAETEAAGAGDMPQAAQVGTGFVTTAELEGAACPTEGVEDAPSTPADDMQGGCEKSSASTAAVNSVYASADAAT